MGIFTPAGGPEGLEEGAVPRRVPCKEDCLRGAVTLAEDQGPPG